MTGELLQPEVITAAEVAVGWLVTVGLLNFRQRKTIRERDGNKCNFPVPNHKCDGSKQLEVNHIYPRKYLLGMGVKNPDIPENLITICRNSHTGDPSNGRSIDPVHPDIRDARKNYANDKKSIEKAIQDQKDKQAERVVWWNDKHDRAMMTVAWRNNEKLDKKGGRKKWWPW